MGLVLGGNISEKRPQRRKRKIAPWKSILLNFRNEKSYNGEYMDLIYIEINIYFFECTHSHVGILTIFLGPFVYHGFLRQGSRRMWGIDI